jgi:hypothetical protein
MSNGESRTPTLVVNPADDAVFTAFVLVLVDHGAVAIRDLESRLRTVYPHAAVHARELSAEPILIWYVYRDGRWVDSRHVTEQSGGRDDDARRAGGPSSDRGIDPA